MTVYDAKLEADVIGAMLVSNKSLARCLDVLTAADFYDQNCAQVFAALERLHAAGAPIDSSIVSSESGIARGWILSTEMVPVAAHGAEYAKRVARDAWLRRVQAFAGDLSVAAQAREADTIEETLQNAVQRLSQPVSHVKAPVDLDAMLARTYDHRWLVPGLLERRDRVMLTGGEGRGKSLLLRQCAVRLAFGIHPFDEVIIDPLKVLIVDLENSEEQVQRSLERLAKLAREMTRTPPSMWVECRPQGMDLTNRGDVRWLDGLLGHTHPDVLVFGSLYKAYSGATGRAKHAEESAEMVARALDELRVKHDCCLFIEAHAGHGESNDRNAWRPFGASLWMRWPEFGFGLKPAGERLMDLASWRGVRERGRGWPKQLREGSGWPWETFS